MADTAADRRPKAVAAQDRTEPTAREAAIAQIVKTFQLSGAVPKLADRELRRLASDAVDELLRLPTFQPLRSPETFKALGHPAHRRIMELVHEHGTLSPAMAVAADDRWTLGTISYHFRILTKVGLLRVSHTRPRRGATEHFYVRDDT